MSQKEQNIISYTSPGLLQIVDTKLMSTVKLRKTTYSRSVKQDNNVIDIKKEKSVKLKRAISVYCNLLSSALLSPQHARMCCEGCFHPYSFIRRASSSSMILGISTKFKALTFGHSCSLHNEDIWSVMKLRIMPSQITPIRMFADGRKDPLGLWEWPS